jgi:putative membrane protein
MSFLRTATLVASVTLLGGCHWQFGWKDPNVPNPVAKRAPAAKKAPTPTPKAEPVTVAQQGTPREEPKPEKRAPATEQAPAPPPMIVVTTADSARPTQRKDAKKPTKMADAKARKAEKTEKVAAKTSRAAKKEAAHVRLTEGHAVAMLLAYNNADISYSRIAASRSRNADVKAFAIRMLTDNASVNQTAMDLVARSDITPEDNATTTDLREISAAIRVQLRDLTGAAFDSAYVAGEIAHHRELLERLDRVFAPGTRNPDLKKLFTSIRPVVVAHLAQAEQIGETLGVATTAQAR